MAGPWFCQAASKIEIWFKVKEEVKRQPEEYMKYFEDWLFTSDAEIGPYSLFEAAWSHVLGEP
jgi:hypothetical protein